MEGDAMFVGDAVVVCHVILVRETSALQLNQTTAHHHLETSIKFNFHLDLPFLFYTYNKGRA
jgi:hypothetical protein